MYLGAGPAFPLVLHISLVFSAGEPKDVFSAAFAHPSTRIIQIYMTNHDILAFLPRGREHFTMPQC